MEPEGQGVIVLLVTLPVKYISQTQVFPRGDSQSVLQTTSSIIDSEEEKLTNKTLPEKNRGRRTEEISGRTSKKGSLIQHVCKYTVDNKC